MRGLASPHLILGAIHLENWTFFWELLSGSACSVSVVRLRVRECWIRLGDDFWTFSCSPRFLVRQWIYMCIRQSCDSDTLRAPRFWHLVVRFLSTSFLIWETTSSICWRIQRYCGSTVDTRFRQFPDPNFTHFLREGGRSSLNVETAA